MKSELNNERNGRGEIGVSPGFSGKCVVHPPLPLSYSSSIIVQGTYFTCPSAFQCVDVFLSKSREP